MRNCFGRPIRSFPWIEQAKAAAAIEFCFGMIAISGEFVTFSGHFDILLDSTTVLETESIIICPVRMALFGRAKIMLRSKRYIFVNANAAFKTDLKTVLRRVFQIS
jgi:hypothetical protein